MAFWIFKYSPEKYRLAERLADPNPTITWTVSRHRDEINPGDIVFVWETGKNRGIRAIIRVDEAPREMAELESEGPYWIRGDADVKWRIVGTITHRDIRCSAEDLRNVPGLEQLSVFRGFQQGTNFPVTPEEGRILLDLITSTQQ